MGPVSKQSTNPIPRGKIISVRDSFVDVWFDYNLPPIALTPTQGLARGMMVETDGKQLTVPVGKSIMGRMFDVFGNTIYHEAHLSTNMERRTIHQSPPLSKNDPQNPIIFFDGDKGDVRIPLERGSGNKPKPCNMLKKTYMNY